MNVPASPLEFTLAEARHALRAKQISAVEIANGFLNAIGDARPLNAFVTETPERAHGLRQDPAAGGRPAASRHTPDAPPCAARAAPGPGCDEMFRLASESTAW